MLPGTVHGQSGPGVEFKVDGRPATFLSGARIEGLPQESHSYHHLGPAGGQIVARTGVTVGQLLSAAGVDPGRVSLLEVARARGGFGYLFRRDLTQPGDFADGPALISVDGSSTRFLRPQRTGADQNAADDIATPDGQSLAISIYTGRLLTVTPAHSPVHAAAGQLVRFSATASCCALGGEQLTYAWSLGDNATRTGALIAHRFAGAGTYQASVAVTGSMGSVALPAQTTVIVGAPRLSKRRGSGGSGAAKSPSTGPMRGSAHPGGGSRGAGRGSGGTTSTRSSAATPTATSRPTQISPAPGAPAVSPAIKPVRAPTTRQLLPAQSTVAGAGLAPVDGLLVAGPGTLLASTAGVPGAPAGAPQSARAGTPAGSGGDLPGGAILAVGIFAVGALYERRGLRARTL